MSTSDTHAMVTGSQRGAREMIPWRPLQLRSLLFVPGNKPDRMRKAVATGADAVILDLEDSVAHSEKERARRDVAAFLTEEPHELPIFVRLNGISSGLIDADLDAIVASPPTAFVLPKASGAKSVADLLSRLSARGNLQALVLPITAESPDALFRLGEFAGFTECLIGITWGAEDLSAALGASSSRHPDGSYTPPYEVARALTLFAARAAGVAPIDTVFPAIGDLEGLAAYARRGARDGFVGMMAIHPKQVSVINAAFTPSDEAVAHARAVVAAFENDPEAGVLTLDGRMIDRPHLERSLRLLAKF